MKEAEILINLVCLVGFLYQTIDETREQFCTGKTTADVSQISLKELNNFPVVFDFIVRPGFDMEELVQEGYNDIDDYFFGRSNSNSTVFGWGGHVEEVADVERKIIDYKLGSGIFFLVHMELKVLQKWHTPHFKAYSK